MRPTGRGGISRDGRRFGGDPPSPYQVPDTPAGKINMTDPDSRLLKAAGIGYVQGYNAQAAVSEDQIVLAAEIVIDSPDFGHLEPMSTRPRPSSNGPASPTHRRSSSPTPATGTTSRWTASPPAASRC
jgi:hypothetical protein